MRLRLPSPTGTPHHVHARIGTQAVSNQQAGRRAGSVWSKIAAHTLRANRGRHTNPLRDAADASWGERGSLSLPPTGDAALPTLLPPPPLPLVVLLLPLTLLLLLLPLSTSSSDQSPPESESESASAENVEVKAVLSCMIIAAVAVAAESAELVELVAERVGDGRYSLPFVAASATRSAAHRSRLTSTSRVTWLLSCVLACPRSIPPSTKLRARGEAKQKGVAHTHMCTTTHNDIHNSTQEDRINQVGPPRHDPDGSSLLAAQQQRQQHRSNRSNSSGSSSSNGGGGRRQQQRLCRASARTRQVRQTPRLLRLAAKRTFRPGPRPVPRCVVAVVVRSGQRRRMQRHHEMQTCEGEQET
jgi:hypothetical protein